MISCGKTDMYKKITAALAALMLCMMQTGCSDIYDGDDDVYDEPDIQDEQEEKQTYSSHDNEVHDASHMWMHVLDDGSAMTINRPARKNEPMGETDTWTVFIYLCGTDLEGRFSSASDDLLELCEAECGDNVRFVIQTGGTEEWALDEISSDKCQRFVIEDGEICLVDSAPLTSMGEADTLSDFLEWGVETYPAEKMGVTIWDHGSGCINGACFDELNDDDSLSLAEMDEAFAAVYGDMTDQFEFIGFDCCLMSTAEVANIMATYARYFYGSQESEPCCGWDYISIADFLAQNPSSDGAELGRVVADSYYEHCKADDQAYDCTFTVVDLSRYDDFVIEFNEYARELYDAFPNNRRDIIRGIKNADDFGGNNFWEGYSNMVDLGGIVKENSRYADSRALLSAMDNVISYKINGKGHKNASGLSLYYPLKVGSTEELEIYSDITLSPYYLAVVDMAAAGRYKTNYDISEIFGENGWYSSMHGIEEGFFDYADESDEGMSTLITFEQEPYVEDNFYSFTLTKEALENTVGVEAYIARDTDDGMVDLGEICDVYEDWDTGEFADSFDGYWFSLPDDQLLPIYIVSNDDDMQVFTSPVMVNGERTNLRITCEGVHNHVEGIWSGIDENGMAGRDLVKLKPGDVICPVYKVTHADKEDTEIYGDDYTWEDGDDVTYSFLTPGDYIYGFGIEDIYGDYYITDFVSFSMDEDGEATFYEE